MKIIYDANPPFSWVHGGQQKLVESLAHSFKIAGIEVEPLRWWDEKQKGDILFTFYNPTNMVFSAKKKGMKVISYIFLDGFSSKTKLQLIVRKWRIFFFRKLFPSIYSEMGWNISTICDKCIFPSEGDAHLAHYLYGYPLKNSHVILHGLEDKYVKNTLPTLHDKNYVIAISTIHQRKNSILIAKLAHVTGIPIVFIGKPYSEEESYFRAFLKLTNNETVIFKGFVDEAEKIRLLSEAKGFIHLSTHESGCLSVLEACALKTPVFLADLPWAKSIYGNHAKYGNIRNFKQLASQFNDFYCSPYTGTDFIVKTWDEAAYEYIEVFKAVLQPNGEN